MRSLLLAMAIATGLATWSRAEVLDVTKVPADAKWLVHIDVDAVVTGEAPQAIGDQWLKHPSVPVGLWQLQRIAGLDPRKDLHSITVFGRRYGPDDGVVVVRAEVDRRRLTRFLTRQPDYRSSSYGEHQLIGWTENMGKKDERDITGCFFQSAVLVFGRDGNEVKKAIDVLRGESSNMADGSPLLETDTVPGSMIEVRGVGLADVKLKFESPLVQKSEYLFAAMGEREGEGFAVARVVTESSEVAGQLRAVLKGLLAMAKLRFDSDEQVLRVLDAVNVSSSENTVAAEFRVSAEDISELLKRQWMKQRSAK